MTGNPVGDEPILRQHGADSVAFCSEECAAQWDAMTPEQRDEQRRGK